ncbi:hypothetical protein [Serinicoccus marinus]|uniref:hypothetical protein n=1 Tax=Serinicoccus marinus TaxID=247333 RepID=UPI00122E2C70|nr:hypothetical protein [Serinicoccus marinus]
MGFLSPSTEALVYAYVAGSLTVAGIGATVNAPTEAADVGLQHAPVEARQILPLLINGLTSNLAIALPIWAITAGVGTEAAGAFFVARKALSALAQLSGTALSDITYRRIASARGLPVRLHSLLSKLRLGLLAGAAAMVVCGVALGFAAPHILSGYTGLQAMLWLFTPAAAVQVMLTGMTGALLALRAEFLLMRQAIARLVVTCAATFWWLDMTNGGLVLYAAALFGSLAAVSMINVTMGWRRLTNWRHL